MITLHYSPGTASFTPHVVLREARAPFELALVDYENKGQKRPEYLRLNPNGRIPTLVDGDEVLYETAAITLHLCDRFPEAELAPAVGSVERARFYRWIAHLSCTVQPEMRPFFYPEQHVQDAAHAADVKQTAEKRMGEMFALVDRQLGDGPYLLGERYSAADPYLLMLVRWGRHFATPPRSLPNLARHVERVLARPAVQEAFAQEGIGAPFV